MILSFILYFHFTKNYIFSNDPKLKMSNNASAGPEITEQEVIRKTGIACDGIRQQVKSCIKKSECVQVFLECYNSKFTFLLQVKRLRAGTCVDNHDLPDKVNFAHKVK